jgi:hypothetical protein
MKNRIIEICELGKPQSIIHRENEPITELIKTTDLVEELNKQLILSGVVAS